MTANFGRRLYDAFFASYTEKVWGIPGSEIHAEWAAQRIKDFSFGKALLRGAAPEPPDADDADRGVPLSAPRARADVGASAGARGGARDPRPAAARAFGRSSTSHGPSPLSPSSTTAGSRTSAVDAVLSSIPLSDLVLSLDPAPPEEIVAAARAAALPLALPRRARDRRRAAVPGQLDLPPRPGDPGGAGPELRGLEPATWSKPGTTCLGVEYFCFEGRRHLGAPGRGRGRRSRRRSSRGSVSSTRRRSSTA